MAAAKVGHHWSSLFAPHSVPRRSTHPVDGSNRHPPDVVSDATTRHFGQATGAINEGLLASKDPSLRAISPRAPGPSGHSYDCEENALSVLSTVLFPTGRRSCWRSRRALVAA